MMEIPTQDTSAQKGTGTSLSFSLPPLLTGEELMALMSLLRNARHIVVCGHRSPDGDALGSALGWGAYLRNLGKQVGYVMPNPFPDFLKWVPGWKQVLMFDRRKEEATRLIESADLVCCLDFNSLHRLQDMGEVVARCKADKLMIDHHPDPDTDSFKMVVSHPEASSTSEVVVRLIDQLGGFEDLHPGAAAALYTGMMTDTGAFSYNANRPEIYLAIAKLIDKGVDKDRIYRNVYHTFSQNRLRLQGYILYEKLEFLAEGRASFFTLTREEMLRFSFIRGDAEGLVNMPLQVKGVKLSISLREDTEKDVVRVSLRSVDALPCNFLAEHYFNGGGHLNASGGELPFPMEEAVRTTREVVETYFRQIDEQDAAANAPTTGDDNKDNSDKTANSPEKS